MKLHTGHFLDANDIRTHLPPKPIKGTIAALAYIFLTYKAQSYYKHYAWRVVLICGTLKLTPFGTPRGTVPNITTDASPKDLVEALDTSQLGN